jgi:hypothetical protein
LAGLCRGKYNETVYYFRNKEIFFHFTLVYVSDIPDNGYTGKYDRKRNQMAMGKHAFHRPGQLFSFYSLAVYH